MILGGIAVIVAIVAGLSAGGDDSGSSSNGFSGSAAAQATPAEDAVLQQAKLLYPQEGITGASCEKTGYSTMGSIYSCMLESADGTITDPNTWSVMEGEGGPPLAQPGTP
jgi:ribulose 1,5-bisphosphate synthetase/thiazole synthase